MKQTLTHKLSRYTTQLSNSANNPTILPKMEAVGYTLPKIQEGLGMVNNVTLLYEEGVHRKGEQNNVGKSCNESLQQLWQEHMTHRKLAQVVYQSDAVMYEDLGLGKLKSSVVQRLAYLEKFYRLLLADSSKMTQVGVKKAELSQMQAAIQALIEARLKHISFKGESQHATQKRNEALRQLDVWMSDFRKAARFALRDEPQLLEILGILVPSVR